MVSLHSAHPMSAERQSAETGPPNTLQAVSSWEVNTQGSLKSEYPPSRPVAGAALKSSATATGGG